MKDHDLPPIIVMRRLTNSPILIKTQSLGNLPIDDVLRFEVSKLPNIMDFDDAQTCLFPPSDERTDIFSSSVLFCVLSKFFFSVLVLFCSVKFEIFVFCSVLCSNFEFYG